MNLPLRPYVRLLAEYLARQRGRLLLLGLLIFGSIGLQLLNPQILRAFIDTAQAGGAAERLAAAAALFIGVALAQQALAVGASYMGELIGWTATNALRGDLLAHALGLDMRYHNARTPGELIERIDGDVTALANFFSQFMLRVFGNGLLLAGLVVLFTREDWRLGLVMGGFVLLTLAALLSTNGLSARYWAAGRAASADFIGFIEERLAGLEDVRSSGAAPYLMRRLYGHQRTLHRRYRMARLVNHLTLVGARVLFVLAQGVALATGAYLFYERTISVGTVYRDPGPVILDEASSRLDPATERAIERAVERLLAGRTAIIIAHKLATVRRVDAIMVLEAGRIVEHGPRAALAIDPGSRFATLLRAGLEEVLT